MPSLLPSPPAFQAVQLAFRSHCITIKSLLTKTTAFLDSAAEMEFCHACTFNSMDLLERIWNASSSESQPSPAQSGLGHGGHWSRMRFLRSDRHYKRFQFRRAIVKAVGIESDEDALKMVQWLFDHFAGCIVPFDAVQLAAERGRVEILQLFICSKNLFDNLVTALTRVGV